RDRGRRRRRVAAHGAARSCARRAGARESGQFRRAVRLLLVGRRRMGVSPDACAAGPTAPGRRSAALPALGHAAVTAAALPVVLWGSVALAELVPLLRPLAALCFLVVAIGAPFAAPLLHFHWQPTDRKSALLAFASALPSTALGYCLFAWIWSLGFAPK